MHVEKELENMWKKFIEFLEIKVGNIALTTFSAICVIMGFDIPDFILLPKWVSRYSSMG